MDIYSNTESTHYTYGKMTGISFDMKARNQIDIGSQNNVYSMGINRLAPKWFKTLPVTHRCEWSSAYASQNSL